MVIGNTLGHCVNIQDISHNVIKPTINLHGDVHSTNVAIKLSSAKSLIMSLSLIS